VPTDLLCKLSGINFIERTVKYKRFSAFHSSKPPELDVTVKDFGQSWRDGRAFHSMIHTIDAGLVDLEKVRRGTNRQNLETAFNTAYEHLGIPKLLDPEGTNVKVD